MLTVLDLFSGIGGFSLGLERTGGFKTIAFCEIDPFCRKVLAKHWPGVPCFEDVTTANFHPGFSDVICGGFPCQDISAAGKRAGITGERSGLWQYMVGAVRVVRPRYVIVENVAALLSNGVDAVLGDLAAIGYDCEWHCIPASAVGAPHRRDRFWGVAYPSRLLEGRQDQWAEWERVGEGRQSKLMADAEKRRRGPRRTRRPDSSGSRQAERPLQLAHAECPRLAGTTRSGMQSAGRQKFFAAWINEGLGGQWEPEPDVGRVAHGVPSRVDRLRSLGNAVVPQIPELIGRAILKAEGLA